MDEVVKDDAAVVDVGDREIVEVTGRDRVPFLHRLVTGDVAGTAVGAGCHALLLTVKGHVVSDMRLFVRAESVRAVVAAGQGQVTAAALSKYAIMDDVTAVPDATIKLLGIYGARSWTRLAAAGVPVPEDFAGTPLGTHASVESSAFGALWLARVRDFGVEGAWIGAPAPALALLEQRLSSAGVGRLGAEAAEAARIENGEPRFGVEITPDYFPTELGLGSAIDYTKGCYLGQEPIVRIRDRGHLNWRLVRLRFGGDLLPALGDPLESEAKPKAGRLTSAARLPGGEGVGLGMLHMSVPVGSEIRIRSSAGGMVAAHVLDEVAV